MHSIPANDFAGNLSNKYHRSVFTEEKKSFYLNPTENCTNKGFSYHLFPNKTEYIKNYNISSETHMKSLLLFYFSVSHEALIEGLSLIQFYI